MSERSIRPVELDQEMALWLSQTDEDPDELVNELLREYRETA
jgi:hypothetical protein